VVNSKPAQEWIIELYQITVRKDSSIRNHWCRKRHQPRTILDLI